MSEDCPKSIFDVSGNEYVVLAGGGEGPEVVDHFVCAGGEECSVLEITNGLNDALF